MTTLFKRVDVTKAYTVGANGEASLTVANLGYTIPTGYGLVGILQFSSGDSRVFIQSLNPSNTASTAVVVRLQNLSNSSITATFSLSVRLVKNSFF